MWDLKLIFIANLVDNYINSFEYGANNEVFNIFSELFFMNQSLLMDIKNNIKTDT